MATEAQQNIIIHIPHAYDIYFAIQQKMPDTNCDPIYCYILLGNVMLALKQHLFRSSIALLSEKGCGKKLTLCWLYYAKNCLLYILLLRHGGALNTADEDKS